MVSRQTQESADTALAVLVLEGLARVDSHTHGEILDGVEREDPLEMVVAVGAEAAVNVNERKLGLVLVGTMINVTRHFDLPLFFEFRICVVPSHPS